MKLSLLLLACGIVFALGLPKPDNEVEEVGEIQEVDNERIDDDEEAREEEDDEILFSLDGEERGN